MHSAGSAAKEASSRSKARVAFRALQVAHGAGRGSRRGAKGGVRIDTDAAFCIGRAMKASADEW